MDFIKILESTKSLHATIPLSRSAMQMNAFSWRCLTFRLNSHSTCKETGHRRLKVLQGHSKIFKEEQGICVLMHRIKHKRQLDLVTEHKQSYIGFPLFSKALWVFTYISLSTLQGAKKCCPLSYKFCLNNSGCKNLLPLPELLAQPLGRNRRERLPQTDRMQENSILSIRIPCPSTHSRLLSCTCKKEAT